MDNSLEYTQEEVEEINRYAFKEQARLWKEHSERLAKLNPRDRLIEKAIYEINDNFTNTRIPLPFRVLSQRFSKSSKRILGSFEDLVTELRTKKEVLILTAPKSRARYIVTQEHLNSLGVGHGTMSLEKYLNTLDGK